MPAIPSGPRQIITFAEAIPIIEGTVKTNEAHHPGWTNKAKALLLDFATKTNKPFSVNDLNKTPEKLALDQVTKTKSGIGAIFKMLSSEGLLVKIKQLQHDETGAVLRRDVGEWAIPSVAAIHNPERVVHSKKISRVAALIDDLNDAEKEIVLNHLMT